METSQFPPLKSLICIFTVIFLTRSLLAYTDPFYLACSVPKTCGDGQIISYPFYIEDQQEPYCGYPGFQLSCNSQGNPVLKQLSNDSSYIVEEIFYDNQSLRVSNAALYTDPSTCDFPRIRNVSLPQEPFWLAPNQTEFVLLYNCNSPLPQKLLQYELRPGGNCSDQTGTVLVMSEDDSDLGSASGECRDKVVAPANVNIGEYHDHGDSLGTEEIIRRGFLLNWMASNCSVCEESGGNCGFNASTYHFNCYCPDRIHAKHCIPALAKARLKLGLTLGFGIGVPTLLILALGLVMFKMCRSKKQYASANLHSGNSSSIPSSNSDLETGTVYFGVPIFSYNDLAEATNNFNQDKELGDGGFGTVYHGRLRDGREVAVKRLYEHNYRRVEQFMNEIKILTRLRHKNLVSLYGCTSRHSQGLLLVYEFVANGTVADHLHGDRAKPGVLTWPIRMNIAIETASALQYLHASDIIHRDVKTNNILLDNNFCVKVADFGLSRLFPNDVTHISTAPQGTPGYVDPEYYQCYQLTSKSDVYSFGVVLIELISSMPAVDISRHRNEINLANLAINRIQKHAIDELIDPCLGYHLDKEVKRMATSVAELAFQCLQQDKEMRPSMEVVLEELHRIQSGGPKFENQKEKQDEVQVLKTEQPPASPPYGDDSALLKHTRVPSSPISVTAKWVSVGTTPNVSS